MGIIKYIGGQFGKPTGIGGRLSTFIMNRMNQVQYKGTAEALGLYSKEQVLDIGFGNGYFLNKLAKKTTCKFYGIEISSDMLHIAERHNYRFIKDCRIILSTGDVVDLNFDNCFFDKVYTINTVYFWSDINKGLSEVMRVLKPGGTFINTVYSKDFLDSLRYTRYGFAKYTLKELEDAAANCGFSVKTVILKSEKSYCLVLQKHI